ncbi:hypothetical protein CK489_03315 [Bradyrhizobium sp. UFLA03-84]|nr:hypothetical protein CK489_03315 [Bradyrhizobium sp. UFLA03-84]
MRRAARLDPAEMKDARMFSTLEGAKNFSKKLKSLFDDSGIIFPLNRCQQAAAIAGGFRDWHDLGRSLAGTDRPVDPGAFRRRLIAFLPQPCWIPVLFWLDERNQETVDGEGLSHNYYRAVVPYVFSSSVIHRSKSALLRPGSGPGQRLRESMVVSLLLGGKGSKRLIPQLEPDTLALVVSGDTASLFGVDAEHPRFEKDLASLVAAGIFEYEDGILRVLPADKDEVAAHAARGFTDRAQYFAGVGGDEAIEALAVALSATGVEQAMRVAEAVLGKGSEMHITPSGPILEMLSKLAGDGQLIAVSRAWRVFSMIHPESANFVRESVPAKISSLYLVRNRGINADKMVEWMSTRSEWAEEVKAALHDPARFKSTVDEMALSIEAAR